MSGKKESTSKGEGRVPTPMPTTPAVIQVKYSKTVKHLSLKELALICRQYGLNYKSGDTKSDLAKKIQKLMPSFLTNTVWKYYFIQEGKTLKIVGKPKDSADFTQREARTDHLLDCDQILQEISNLRILALDDEQMSISSDCDEEEGENITIKHEYVGKEDGTATAVADAEAAALAKAIAEREMAESAAADAVAEAAAAEAATALAEAQAAAAKARAAAEIAQAAKDAATAKAQAAAVVAAAAEASAAAKAAASAEADAASQAAAAAQAAAATSNINSVPKYTKSADERNSEVSDNIQNSIPPRKAGPAHSTHFKTPDAKSFRPPSRSPSHASSHDSLPRFANSDGYDQQPKPDMEAFIKTVLETSNLMNKQTHNPSVQNFRFTQKVKYDSSLGVEAFIRSVEAYTSANSIHDDLRKIAIAKSALNASEEGISMQDALQPHEEQSWTLFKACLIKTLGNSVEYYQDCFDNFKRGSERIGIAFNKIIQAYRRGYLEENRGLDPRDERMITKKFIRSFSNPLRNILLIEEDRLTFSTVVSRAQHLERINESSSTALNVISTEAPLVTPQAAPSAPAVPSSSQSDMLLELINVIKAQGETTQKAIAGISEGTKKTSKKSDPKYFELVKKSQGNCIRFARGKCDVAKCPYKHENPAWFKELVEKHFKSE